MKEQFTLEKQKVGAIIVAAGESRRMEGIDKVFAPLNGTPLLIWSVQVFEDCNAVDEIVIVLNPTNLENGERFREQYEWKKVSAICTGGARRQDSVRNGLHNLPGCDWVIIHDGARPFVTEEIISKGLQQALKTGAAIAAMPVKDTIKSVSADGTVTDTPSRDFLRAAQTPQIFRSDLIEKAHQQIMEDITDDAMMVEKLGHPVMTFEGCYDNIKVTTPQDLALAEIILQNRECA